MIDLKPCPFCGGKANFNYNLDLEPDGIRCMKCKTVLRFNRIHVGAGKTFEPAMEAMADVWNRRVTNENLRTEK